MPIGAVVIKEIGRQPEGTGVERVLDQFLDYGGRTLDDLAGGDLVDQVFG